MVPSDGNLLGEGYRLFPKKIRNCHALSKVRGSFRKKKKTAKGKSVKVPKG